jgi:hypothetical protein
LTEKNTLSFLSRNKNLHHKKEGKQKFMPCCNT